MYPHFNLPIIDFIIRHITFTFIDKYYLQTNGTALGTKMTPAFAKNFMVSIFAVSTLHILYFLIEIFP